MIAEIISIGEELLIGQTTNTNASWLAVCLNGLGIRVGRISVIGDDEEEIFEMLEQASGRAGLILVTGGLGPTRDDVTKTAICRFFDSEMVLNKTVMEDNEQFFRKRGLGMNELNRQQAMVPDKAGIFRNPHGTAPGLWIEKDNKMFAFMPGVPHEMKHMTEDHLLPALRTKSGNNHIIHKTILTQGIGESFLAEKISDWEDGLPAHIRLAYLPSPGIVKLRLSASGPDEEFLRKSVMDAASELHSLIPQYIWGEDEENLEEVVGAMLRRSGESLATAESCTGGHIAAKITSVPGCSDYFKGSVVAYSNAVKENLLGIPQGLINTHGAVSREVVEAMAVAGREKLNADYSIAVSGIAGPSGGSPEKPAGTVWIAVSGSGSTVSRRFQFGDTRERNILRAGVAALGMLKAMLDKQ
jgi:nicotinamide-nucleotide amidase